MLDKQLHEYNNAPDNIEIHIAQPQCGQWSTGLSISTI
jgi:hypothetical protein